MKYITIIFILLSTFHGKEITISKLINYYKNKEYKKVCLNGLYIFNKLKNDENLVNMYGFSCLKSDYIDRISVPAVVLKQSKTSRQNAIYFLTILLQKKILFAALFDNFKISDIRLPATKHIISKIFKLYQENRYKKEGDEYIFQDPEKQNIKYKLFLKRDQTPVKIVIFETYQNKIIKKHTYW